MATRIDLYQVLGVDPAATDVELSRAYHSQLRRHHPDTRDDSARSELDEPAEAIRILVEAYAVLRDPARRTEYDRQRARTTSASRAAEPPRQNLDLLRAVSPVSWQPSAPRVSQHGLRRPITLVWWPFP